MQVSPEGNQFDLSYLLHQNIILDCMFIFRLGALIGISTSLDMLYYAFTELVAAFAGGIYNTQSENVLRQRMKVSNQGNRL